MLIVPLEILVVIRDAVGDQGQQDWLADRVHDSATRRGEVLRVESVGVQRQVRAVLLDGTPPATARRPLP